MLIMKKFEKDNKMVREHLMSHMTNPYSINLSPSNLLRLGGGKLEVKYDINDARKKKYVGEWLLFQITGDKSVMEEAHVYENLDAEVLSECIQMYEIL